jgi:hypothetical protein
MNFGTHFIIDQSINVHVSLWTGRLLGEACSEHDVSMSTRQNFEYISQNPQSILTITITIGVRDGGGRGGSCPPKKITKSKSRANVQHKSGEE